MMCLHLAFKATSPLCVVIWIEPFNYLLYLGTQKDLPFPFIPQLTLKKLTLDQNLMV